MLLRAVDRHLADRLWAQYARTRDPRTREAIIRQFEPLAYSLAGRFGGRGLEDEDLRQVALVGLIKAVDRFDPHSGNRFTTYAVPTIAGEIRRHFRDHAWRFHVPRRLQEHVQRMDMATRKLTERLGRLPRLEEIAAHLNVDEAELRDVLVLRDSDRVLSLDREEYLSSAGRICVLEDVLGGLDERLEARESAISVRQVLPKLQPEYRLVIEMRYFQQMTQREVAEQLGVSQMQVCRLERRALAQLRLHLARQ